MKAKKYASKIQIVIPKKSKAKYTEILERYKRYRRSSIRLSENSEELIIIIEAKDLNALKASTNGIIREIQIIDRIKKL